MEADLDQLRFPIGKYQTPEDLSKAQLDMYIQLLDDFPKQLEEKVKSFSFEQLHATYRPGGWTALQVLHHIADSHMNAYIRCKLALTEDNPVIKPYDEAAWANLEDGLHAPVDISLQIIAGVHHRLTHLLRSLDEQTLQRTFFHPEHNREFTIAEVIAMYTWHASHHYSHLELCANNA